MTFPRFHTGDCKWDVLAVPEANIESPSQLPWRLPVFTRMIAPWVTVVSGLIELLFTPSLVGLPHHPRLTSGRPFSASY